MSSQYGDGSVYQRGDGYWVASLQVDGKRRTVYAKSEREAKRKLGDLRQQVAVSGAVPDSGTRTVNDLLDAWLSATKPTLKARTWVDYELVARRYVRDDIGRVKLSKLSPERIQRLYTDLQLRDLARIPAQVHAVLHRALRLGVMWRWLADNPCDRVLPPRYRAPRKEVWTREQLGVFLDATQHDRVGALWCLLSASGCRLGEALALRWDDFDVAAGTVQIRATIQRIRGEWVTTSPKTAAGTRTLLLPPWGVDALRRHRAAQAAERLATGAAWVEAGYVFASESGGVLHPSTVQHAMARTVDKLGLPPATPHQLRHLHASLLLDAGIGIPSVSARLGHAKPNITLGVYGHRIGDADRAAADVMQRAVAR